MRSYTKQPKQTLNSGMIEDQRVKKIVSVRRILPRTVQAWLGHKNLETTQKYLGVTGSGKLRGQIDAAFGD